MLQIFYFPHSNRCSLQVFLVICTYVFIKYGLSYLGSFVSVAVFVASVRMKLICVKLYVWLCECARVKKRKTMGEEKKCVWTMILITLLLKSDETELRAIFTTSVVCSLELQEENNYSYPSKQCNSNDIVCYSVLMLFAHDCLIRSDFLLLAMHTHT